MEGVGSETSGTPQYSDNTVREAGIIALEGDIGIAVEKLTENQNLVRFWNQLYKKGGGTNNIAYM